MTSIAKLPLRIKQSSNGLRARQGAMLLGIGVSTYWGYSKRPDFPAARRPSAGVTIWVESEVIAWRDAQKGIPPRSAFSRVVLSADKGAR